MGQGGRGDRHLVVSVIDGHAATAVTTTDDIVTMAAPLPPATTGRPSHVYSADPGQLLGAWGVGIGRGGPGWVREAMDRPAKRATCPTMHAWLWSQNGDKIYYYTSTRSTCQKGW